MLSYDEVKQEKEDEWKWQAQFGHDFVLRRNLHPRDQRIAWCFFEYMKGVKFKQRIKGKPGEMEALEAWIKKVQENAKRLLDCLNVDGLQEFGEPLIPDRGELFWRTFAGGLAIRWFAGPEPGFFFMLGHSTRPLFLSVLADLADNPEVSTHTQKYMKQFEPPPSKVEVQQVQPGMVIQTYPHKKKQGGNAGDHGPPLFAILCARLAKLLQEAAGKKNDKRCSKDIVGLVRYWNLRYEGVNPIPKDKKIGAVYAHIRQLVNRGQAAIDKMAPLVEGSEIKTIYYDNEET